MAEALSIVGHEIISVQSAFGVGARVSVSDPDVIEWCRENDRTWITADKDARRRWEANLKSSMINVVWVGIPKNGLSAKGMLRGISRFLERIENELKNREAYATHWKIGMHEKARLEKDWEKRRAPQ